MHGFLELFMFTYSLILVCMALPITDSEMIPTVLLINDTGIFDECLSKAAGSCDCSISVSTVLSTK